MFETKMMIKQKHNKTNIDYNFIIDLYIKMKNVKVC